MKSRMFLLQVPFTLFLIILQVAGGPISNPNAGSEEYRLEAYLQGGDPQTLILRIQPHSLRNPRQEEEEEESVASLSAAATVSPFIPAVIPALTKIFTGIITGNLNEIFHGSTAFAPQNVSHAIDTIYNHVVGLPPPISTSRRPLVVETTPAPTTLPPAPETTPRVAPAPPQSQATEAYYLPAAVEFAPGQPLGSLGSIIITPSTTPRRVSNEDDDEI